MKLTQKLTAGLLAAGIGAAGLIYVPQVMASSAAKAPVTAEAPEKAEAGDTDDAAVLAQAKVTVEQARQAAQKAYADATVTSATLEDENGKATYSVLLTSGGKQLDVKVDAVTGQVLHADSDQDGENAND